MRVLVTGGRNYANKERALGKEGEEARTILAAVERERELIWQALWTLGPTVVIEGAAKGADQAAYEWAREAGVMPCRFRAEWTRYGNFAGVRRNGVMLREGQPDLVLAFPGGRGTRDMVERARKVERICGDWRPGRYAYRLANVRRLETPIPARGKQGLWRVEVPEEVLRG